MQGSSSLDRSSTSRGSILAMAPWQIRDRFMEPKLLISERVSFWLLRANGS